MANSSEVYIVDDDEAIRRSLAFLLRAGGLRSRTFESAEAFLDEAVELREYAEKLAHESDALAALVTWLRQQLVFGAHGRSMGAAVMNAKHTEGTEIQLACLAMRESGAVLLRRAQDAGEVRATSSRTVSCWPPLHLS